MGFYCQKVCGGNDYKKEQINETLRDCERMGFTAKEKETVLKEVHRSFQCKCVVQCTYCAKVVAERQNKTKSILST